MEKSSIVFQIDKICSVPNPLVSFRLLVLMILEIVIMKYFELEF